MQVQPYLMFNGRCEEALEFYKKTLGAQVTALMRFSESPEPPPPGCAPVDGQKIMHSAFTVGESTVMASDGMTVDGKPVFQGISLSLIAKDEAEAKRLFDNLGNGGQVQMPLGKTFFSPAFGVLADRFGVSWMVVVMQEPA